MIADIHKPVLTSKNGKAQTMPILHSCLIERLLRHTFASRLAMKGVNSLTLQLLGRWEEPKMLQRYVHLSSEDLAEALEEIQPQKNFTPLFTPVPKRRNRKVS